MSEEECAPTHGIHCDVLCDNSLTDARKDKKEGME